MKKFDFDANLAQIIPPSSPKTEKVAKTFDINQLLQIIPKLNLNGIFSKPKETNSAQNQVEYQNNTSPNSVSAQFQESFVPNVNFMRSQNLRLAKTQLQNHSITVQKIRQNNQKDKNKDIT